MQHVLREWLLLLIGLCLLSGVLIAYQSLDRLDFLFYDVSVRTLFKQPPPEDILIVAIDDESLQTVGRWPWRRNVLATLIDKLSKKQVRGIMLDVFLPESNHDDPAGDKLLAETIQRANNVVLPVTVWQREDGQTDVVPPYPGAAEAAWSLGNVMLEPDSDGTIRAVPLSLVINTQRYYTASLLLPGVTWPTAVETHSGALSSEVLVPFTGGPKHYHSLSALSVLRDELPSEMLRSAWVLIGMTAVGGGDSHTTPTTFGLRTMPGVEIHANILDAVLTHRLVGKSRHWVEWVLACAALVVVMGFFLRANALFHLPIVALTTVLILSFSAAFLHFGKLWIPPGTAVFCVLIAWPLWGWRRLVGASKYFDTVADWYANDRWFSHELKPDTSKEKWVDPLERQFQNLVMGDKAWEESHALLELILERMPAGVVVCTEEDGVLYANSRAMTLLGVDESFLKTQPFILKWLQNLTLAKGEFKLEDLFSEQHSMQALGPHHRHVMVSWTQIADKVRVPSIRRLTVLTLDDRTELVRSLHSREELLRFLAHDLRSPQASILAIIEQRRVAEGLHSGEHDFEHFHVIEQYAKRALELADDFVSVARAETIAPAQFEPVSFSDIVMDACDEAWVLASKATVVIKRDIPFDEECLINADRGLVLRAVFNLLSNAIKHAKPHTEVSVRLFSIAQNWCVEVADKGDGVPENRRHDLFELFATGNAINGVGLGLYFVRLVSDRHGGAIHLVSAPGEGAIFQMTLPKLLE